VEEHEAGDERPAGRGQQDRDPQGPAAAPRPGDQRRQEHGYDGGDRDDRCDVAEGEDPLEAEPARRRQRRGEGEREAQA
jgi:hypothetical protein